MILIIFYPWIMFMDNMNNIYNLTRNHYDLFQSCTAVFVAKIIRNLKKISLTNALDRPAAFDHLQYFLLYLALLLQCYQNTLSLASFKSR